MTNHSNFNETEVDLLARLQQGEEQAWRLFVQMYGIRVHKYLTQKLPDAETVEDIFGDTMLDAVRSIRDFDGRISLSTFLFALANRKLREFEQRRSQPSSASSIWTRSWFTEQTSDWPETLARVPEAYRQLLHLRYQTGLGIDEIAQVLGLSYKATEHRLREAHQQLQKILADQADPSPYPEQMAIVLYILKSAIQLLFDQRQRCLALGMTNEAAIFAYYAHLLTHITDDNSSQFALVM